MGITTVFVETGDTMEENACLKAVSLCYDSKLVTLADDSRLFIDALNGAPGAGSVRCAGENIGDPDRFESASFPPYRHPVGETHHPL